MTPRHVARWGSRNAYFPWVYPAAEPLMHDGCRVAFDCPDLAHRYSCVLSSQDCCRDAGVQRYPYLAARLVVRV